MNWLVRAVLRMAGSGIPALFRVVDGGDSGFVPPTVIPNRDLTKGEFLSFDGQGINQGNNQMRQHHTPTP